MSALPDPLTPADCDLRGLEYMPLLGSHLFGSEFNAKASDLEFRVAVTLWWAAWTQHPAASLPDDDQALCKLADLGRDLRTWRKVKKVALHRFVKCYDGRLYHPTLAKQANIAWEKRVNDRKRKAEWRARRDAERAGQSEFDLEENQELNENSHADATRTEQSRHAENALNRRDGTGRDVSKKPKPSPPISESIPLPKPAHANDCFNEICDAADWTARTDEQRSEALSIIDGWLASGFDVNDDILAGIRLARSRKPEKTRNLKRFTSTIRGRHDDRQGSRLNGSGEVGDLHRQHEAREIVKRTVAGLSASG